MYGTRSHSVLSVAVQLLAKKLYVALSRVGETDGIDLLERKIRLLFLTFYATLMRDTFYMTENRLNCVVGKSG